SAVPRNMLRAIGEVMVVDDQQGRRTKSFTDFTVQFATDAQFARWFADLDRVLNEAEDGNSFARDRLIAAGANLRALLVLLDPKNRNGSPRHIENRKRITYQDVRILLEDEFPRMVDTRRVSAVRRARSRAAQLLRPEKSRGTEFGR